MVDGGGGIVGGWGGGGGGNLALFLHTGWQGHVVINQTLQ